MSTINHAAEAQRHYEDAVEANQNGKWETSRFEMKLAEFHIAAAGVEQQRIANLVAFAAAQTMQYTAMGLLSAENYSNSEMSSSFERSAAVNAKIIEGLGL